MVLNVPKQVVVPCCVIDPSLVDILNLLRHGTHGIFAVGHKVQLYISFTNLRSDTDGRYLFHPKALWEDLPCTKHTRNVQGVRVMNMQPIVTK